MSNTKESQTTYYTKNGLLVFAPIIAYVIFGAAMYRWLEGFSVVDSYYFVVITLSTIGYGDLSPHTDAGKIFTIFFIIFGLALFSTLITTLVNRAGVRKQKRAAQRSQLKGDSK
jgi:voltage-gated potassium channel